MDFNDFSKSDIISILTVIATILMGIFYQRYPSKLAKKQLVNLEAEEKRHTVQEQNKLIPKLDVTIQQLGRNYYFYITNKGYVDIYNVNFEIINNADNPLYDAHDKLPLKELRTNNTLKLGAAFTLSSPSKYEVKLSWTDEQGNPVEEIFYPTM